MDLLHHCDDDDDDDDDSCETEAINETPFTATQQPQQSFGAAGRWATHCSLGPLRLRRAERRRAAQAVRATCAWIQQRSPHYRGRCVPLWRRNSELHISLTRPDVSLHTNHIDSFVQLLSREIQMVAAVAPFDISFVPTESTTHLELLHNSGRTQSFGIWRCARHPALLQLTHCCNTILQQHYQQCPYRYSTNNNEDPIFHISLVRFEPAVLPELAGAPGNIRGNERDSVPPMASKGVISLLLEEEEEGEDTYSSSDDDDDDDSDSSLDNSSHRITQVTCQFGGAAAKIHRISLMPRVDQLKM